MEFLKVKLLAHRALTAAEKDHRRDRYRCDVLERAKPVLSDSIGKTIARFTAAGTSSLWSGGVQPILGKHQSTSMDRAQHVGEHCGRRTGSPNLQSLGSLPGN